MWWILLGVWGTLIVFYLLFLVYAAYQAAIDAGRIVPKRAKLLAGPALLLGYLIDLSWNAAIGTLLFWEKPWAEDRKFWSASWTFTARLKRWKNDRGWRGWQARQWAKFLDWAQQGGHV